jgi:hypothetical protein
MTRAAEPTGPGPMALVAVEQRFPPGQRVLVDEPAGRMLPYEESAAIFGEQVRRYVANGARRCALRPDASLPGIRKRRA